MGNYITVRREKALETSMTIGGMVAVGCVLCAPCWCFALYVQGKVSTYADLILSRARMEAPNAVPSLSSKRKTRRHKGFYTEEGHWIVPHMMCYLLIEGGGSA